MAKVVKFELPLNLGVYIILSRHLVRASSRIKTQIGKTEKANQTLESSKTPYCPVRLLN